jgi:2-phospho-L-lactate guanylyltransferase
MPSMTETARPAAPSRPFGVVVPVKPAAVAKSRLQPLGDDVRRELVGAFAVDTVLAALECPLVDRVLVVTDDVTLAGTMRDLGVLAIPDGQSGALNGSLSQGAAEVVRRRPTLRPVALCADLPALHPEDLAAALEVTLQRATPSFVADTAGVGTTMYVAPSLAAFVPRFGARSAEVHSADGAVEVGLEDIGTLRRDVDTPEDLRVAAELGLGSRTSWVITRRRLL